MRHELSLDEVILQLLKTKEFAEQSQLQEALRELGHDIPQATLSRRLKKLHVAKISGIYKAVDFHRPSLPPILRAQIAEPNLIVLHTYPGQANGLAYFIDQKYINSSSPDAPPTAGILGTIAGDDTLVLIIKAPHFIKIALETLREDFLFFDGEETGH